MEIRPRSLSNEDFRYLNIISANRVGCDYLIGTWQRAKLIGISAQQSRRGSWFLSMIYDVGGFKIGSTTTMPTKTVPFKECEMFDRFLTAIGYEGGIEGEPDFPSRALIDRECFVKIGKYRDGGKTVIDYEPLRN